MKKHTMRHQNIAADDRWEGIGGNMDNRAVLYIAARTDPDIIDIPAHDTIVPDTGARPHIHIADELCSVKDEGIIRHAWPDALERAEPATKIGVTKQGHGNAGSLFGYGFRHGFKHRQGNSGNWVRPSVSSKPSIRFIT